MDVTVSSCVQCGVRITYSEALLLSEGSGVCENCDHEKYEKCDECGYHFEPNGYQEMCGTCITKVFTEFI